MSINKEIEIRPRGDYLEVYLERVEDIIDGDLPKTFLDKALKIYQKLEYAERKKHNKELPVPQRLKNFVKKRDEEIPLRDYKFIFYPRESNKRSNKVIESSIEKYCKDEMASADKAAEKWERAKDMFLLGIAPAAAVSSYIFGGREAITGGGWELFAYLAILGDSLVIPAYFLKYKEATNKRKINYLKRIRDMPVRIYRGNQEHPVEKSQTGIPQTVMSNEPPYNLRR